MTSPNSVAYASLHRDSVAKQVPTPKNMIEEHLKVFMLHIKNRIKESGCIISVHMDHLRTRIVRSVLAAVQFQTPFQMN